MLVVENVSHGFGGRTILENVSFRLRKGEHIALIGANGEGKSTFLNIITKKLMPDAGNIKWSSRVTVGYLDQHTVLTKGKSIREVLRDAFKPMFDLEQEMISMYDKMGEADEDEMTKLMEGTAEIQTILENSGFYMIDAKIQEIANGLGLGEIGLDKDVTDLSGGQRTKVLLTKLLLENPVILILDEPTNYLDVEHIAWLTRYLQEYENSFILVSHDVPFINDTCNVIYHMENGELNRYKGNYDEFERLRDIKKRQEEQAYDKQIEERKRLEDFVARNKARVATRGMANSRQKQLDKMEILERPKEKIKPTFKFTESRASSRFVFTTEDLVLGYDEALTKPLNFTLERNQKIALRGMNGIGKSTLLKTLLGIIKPFDGKVELGDYLEVGYFEQESSRENSNTPMDEIWAEYPGLTNFEVRQSLSKCGLTNDHITSQMRVLSGGEAAKVRLCKLMLKQINFLVLDEPTNHLDVEAKDELKKAIREFKGTVLLVSHEPEFYEDIVDDVWNIEDFTTKIV
ncbi:MULTISPECIES: ribosomal protection-like ABC-F family protein [Paraclostridium]|jgi:ATPase subunit of ABC transporter with duplicated ATPase domains|uniref:ABC transporter ATP-binding protein n=2 Tax=Paraclostridium bifermentans TaxID=1490 RepID=A0A1X2JGL1_PARBF|nr:MULTISPECIES: ABC-F family ATP-binding cassette domain-containing protein [Paraclostridium]KGJ49208.1 heme ABC transporter ATP-binding protein [Clostridium sp. NCR]MDV8112623.1 ABC-F family ATP-binding cassette domain-containing protein [Bacillus sp. BAU-SS-2023]RDC48913.1 ABC transporter ATP-binding protein [Acinetobacter sp. RIT592]EQK44788.1 heme ABC exporter, ATP-binding protein CcmA [[Clostridium] bifermentans ATCC 638] [Paraclostridium bifermentans ATCC 638 = DSM 14991]EQK48151.1 heme